MMTANILNATALVSLELHVGTLTNLTLVWAGIVICFAVFGWRIARRFRRGPRREAASPRAPDRTPTNLRGILELSGAATLNANFEKMMSALQPSTGKISRTSEII
ncbi:hypothetical protein DFP92_10668 [Yoonia sediminilitoris]|uniref:Uncharacterized protein n=1 Tax=Yoonia sediminilitoris TaxID=1286148 RepID=A0A2T6KFW8_9RHOB|nr:hypothetical protein C8N45_10668 [Yoonia sediminilitoris]RCW95125.1 hypothetical protein DFP92_10668 [Yoonia sediminilitoris]